MSEYSSSLEPDNLDYVLLRQTMTDFQTANQRVVQLTEQLINSENMRKRLEEELEAFRSYATINKPLLGVAEIVGATINLSWQSSKSLFRLLKARRK